MSKQIQKLKNYSKITQKPKFQKTLEIKPQMGNKIKKTDNSLN